jgi:hypothetical protein
MNSKIKHKRNQERRKQDGSFKLTISIIVLNFTEHDTAIKRQDVIESKMAILKFRVTIQSSL